MSSGYIEKIVQILLYLKIFLNYKNVTYKILLLTVVSKCNDRFLSDKSYHKEEYSDVVDEIFEKYSIAISELSIVEFVSILRKKVDERIIKKKK